MIPLGNMFLTEGVFDRFKNSITSLWRNRWRINRVIPQSGLKDKVSQSNSIQRRLTPGPDRSDSDKLGFKPMRTLKNPSETMVK